MQILKRSWLVRLSISLCGGSLVALSLPLANPVQADWPTFRGADRTATSNDEKILEKWPENGPKLLWQAEGAGRGYASPAIADGKIYTLGDSLSTKSDKLEYLSCFDEKSGKQIWTLETGEPWNSGSESWQGSRSTPTIDGDHVYVITPFGVLVCSTTDGKLVWRKDLNKELDGNKADGWGYSESVLIDGDRLVCTPGGSKTTMVAMDKMTGKPIWKCQRPNDRGAGHSSIVMSNVGGIDVYVQVTGSGPMGVRAKDGELMWTYDIDKTTAVIPTPIVRDDLVFMVAGYKRGGALLRQVPKGNKVDIQEIYGLQTDLSNKHGGVVLIGDYIYGGIEDNNVIYCADLMTGDIKWKSRSSGKGSASIAVSGDRLFIRYDDGTMTLVEVNPTEFVELNSFKTPHSGSRPSWAHPVISDGKLFLREGDYILCYDVSQ